MEIELVMAQISASAKRLHIFCIHDLASCYIRDDGHVEADECISLRLNTTKSLNMTA